MADAARTLANLRVARLAEIVAPWIGEVLRRGFVEHQRLVVALAAVGRAFAVQPADAAGFVAIAPRVERLRFGESGCPCQRKPDLRVDVIVGAATISFIARVGDQLAGREIGEILRHGLRPCQVQRRRLCRGSGCAAGNLQAFEEAAGDGVGVTTRQTARRHAPVEALNRDHIRHAEPFKSISNVCFAQDASQARNVVEALRRCVRLRDVRTVEVVDESRAGHLDLDRARIADRQPRALLEEKAGVVAGRAGQEEIGRPEAADGDLCRRILGVLGVLGRRIDRQQHRHSAFRDIRKTARHPRIEPCEYLGRAGAVATGDGARGGFPIDGADTGPRRQHLARTRRGRRHQNDSGEQGGGGIAGSHADLRRVRYGRANHAPATVVINPWRVRRRSRRPSSRRCGCR